jgi:hypothetical protein
MVERIDGSCTNVVGLPLCEVVAALRTIGAMGVTPSSRPERHLPEPRDRRQRPAAAGSCLLGLDLPKVRGYFGRYTGFPVITIIRRLYVTS